MERSLITVGGRLGSGRSTHAKNITEGLQPECDARYISFGETVRAIGRQSITSFYSQPIIDHLNSSTPDAPLDDEIAYGIMTEALTRIDDADLGVIDNYPKTETQAAHLIDLAVEDERKIAGLIITTTDEETALERLLRRGRRGLNNYRDEYDTLKYIREHDQAFGGAVLYLYNKGYRFERIDTSGSKEESTEKGIFAAKSFLNLNNTGRE